MNLFIGTITFNYKWKMGKYSEMSWFNTGSIKWQLYAYNDANGHRFKKLLTTKL